ncbi:MAG: ABC-2 transporter permease [Sarcina sp.]
MDKTRIKSLMKMDLNVIFQEKIFIFLSIFFIALGFAIPFFPSLLIPTIGFICSLDDVKHQQYGVSYNKLFSIPVKKSEIVISKFLLQLVLIIATIPCYVFFGIISLEIATYVFLATASSAMIFCSILTFLTFAFSSKVTMIVGVIFINIMQILNNDNIMLNLDSKIPLNASAYITFLLIGVFIIIPLSIILSIKALEKKQLA